MEAFQLLNFAKKINYTKAYFFQIWVEWFCICFILDVFCDDPFNVGYLKFRGNVNAAMVVAQWPPVTI